ncbi:MAG TPA: F0F1 ATP synthase subunit epsilon [Halanaerobiales bacterium]|nr:F0F1 ATP synthase subunit epsilon [Halanaerobiales bacterium]
MSTIKLDIVTPERVVYSEEIEMLVATAIDGDIGILPGHTPLVTGLVPCVLKIDKGGEKIHISVSDGFMDVKPEEINVVVRTAEFPEEIDIERAEEAKERAKKRLEKEDDRTNKAKANSALERALARINAAERKRK